MIFSRNVGKSTGESKYHVLKKFPILLFMSTAPLVFVQCLCDFYQSFLYVESSEDLPQSIMPDYIECFLEVYSNRLSSSPIIIV